MAAFSALDVIVLLLVGGAGILGFLRGFTTEILSLLAWVAAVLAVKFFYEPARALSENWVGEGSGASVLGFALVFGVTFIACRLLARSLGKQTRQSVLGPFDRILGVGFGMLKGLIIATVLYLAAALVYDTLYGMSSERPDWMRESRTYPLLHASGRALVDFVEEQRGRAVDPDRETAGNDTAEAG